MTKKRSVISLVVALLAGSSLLFFSGLASADDIVFGLSQRTLEHAVHNIYANVPQKMAKKDGFKMLFSSADLDPAKQASDLEDMLSQGVNSFIIVPQNKQQIVPSINKINEKGFPVVALDCTPAGGNFLFIGANTVLSGELSAEHIFSKLNGRGKVFFIVGDPAHEYAIRFTTGYKNILKKYPGIKVAAEQGAWWQTDKALKLVEDLLLVNPDVKAILCNNDLMAIGAIEALKGAGYKPGEVLVSGGDGDKAALDLIKKGWLTCTIDKMPDLEASTAYNAALALSKGEKVECVYGQGVAQILTEVLLVDKSNADERPGY
jgi:ABC-type sugar transport system substrate-binding protein